jgi:arginyl-tRNA synthetase
MYKSKIEQELRKAVTELGFVPPSDIVLSISEKQQFGDYSSNIALQLSKQKHQNSYQSPQEIANAIIEALGHPKFLERVEAAGPGFLNFFIKDGELVKILTNPEDPDSLLDYEDLKKIVVEYCDPNTHKMLHIGHLLQLTLGESMARLFEYQGHEVYRTNYGSDIGPTVAKCLWGVERMGQKIEEIREKGLREKAQFLGEAYAFAHKEYEKSLEVKEEIDQITNKLYQRDSKIMPLWDETKEWSLSYFELIYSSFGTLFDKRINESEVDELGKEIVLENVGKVFVKDDGAIIFPGEKHNLHNRVFINSKGNPTYEGKEVGLAEKYQQILQFDQLNIFSHKEQDDYFKVVIAANSIIHPHLKGKINHVSYGEVRLPSGKMSSRQGNIVAAEDILDEVKVKIREISPELDDLSIQALAVAAIKFAFLKYSVGSDMIYDVDESVSIHGDTGPYVMYVYARIQSILRKAAGNRANEIEAEEEEVEKQDKVIAQNKSQLKIEDLEAEEREMLRQLEYFEIIVEKATVNFQPNELVKYLLTLTKAFNSFYEKLPVVGSKSESFRLILVRRVAENIKLGLYLLGVETVEKM